MSDEPGKEPAGDEGEDNDLGEPRIIDEQGMAVLEEAQPTATPPPEQPAEFDVKEALQTEINRIDRERDESLRKLEKVMRMVLFGEVEDMNGRERRIDNEGKEYRVSIHVGLDREIFSAIKYCMYVEIPKLPAQFIATFEQASQNVINLLYPHTEKAYTMRKGTVVQSRETTAYGPPPGAAAPSKEGEGEIHQPAPVETTALAKLPPLEETTLEPIERIYIGQPLPSEYDLFKGDVKEKIAAVMLGLGHSHEIWRALMLQAEDGSEYRKRQALEKIEIDVSKISTEVTAICFAAYAKIKNMITEQSFAILKSQAQMPYFPQPSQKVVIPYYVSPTGRKSADDITALGEGIKRQRQGGM